MGNRIQTEYPDPQAVLKWHEIMFRPLVPLSYYAGNFRQIAQRKPCLDTRIFVGDAEGEPAATTPDAIDALFNDLRRDLAALELTWRRQDPRSRAESLAVAISRCVGRYIQIHPFVNGNGRTSRLLWAAILARFGVGPQASILHRPAGDYGKIMAACMDGDFSMLVGAVLLALAKGYPPSEP